MKKNYKDIIILVLLAAAFVILIVFEAVKIRFSDDGVLNSLLKEFIPRIAVGGVLVAVTALLGEKKILLPKLNRIHFDLLWCIPCFLVVLANFPFTALISGNAVIERTDLIWLFVLKCLSVGLMEEALFRGLVQSTVYGVFDKKPYAKLKTVAVTSAVFGLFHLLNLFAGAGIGPTLMQVGYSFLIGAMLSAVLFKTSNLWLCVILHAAFNVGGFIVTDLGTGAFQDTYFWIFTAVAGVICFAHVLYYLLEIKKKEK